MNFLKIKELLASFLSGTSAEYLIRKIYLTLSKDNQGILYDFQTIEIMERVLSRNSNCIDVGCHLGTKLRWMLRFAPNGKHFAFEPIPQLYQYLVQAFKKRNNVNIYEIALSDRIGESDFHIVTKDFGYSSFQKRPLRKKFEDVEKITVQIDRLDKVIVEDLPIDFIKVDVEGAEFQVFEGAIETIMRNRPFIIFEHCLGGADCYGTSSDDIYHLLVADAGLKISLMEDWLKRGNQDSLQKSEFDAQFWERKNFYFLAHP